MRPAQTILRRPAPESPQVRACWEISLPVRVEQEKALFLVHKYTTSNSRPFFTNAFSPFGKTIASRVK